MIVKQTFIMSCVYITIEQSSGSDGTPIKATAPMWRCSRIMHLLRDLHPTLLSALEGIVDQVYTIYTNLPAAT